MVVGKDVTVRRDNKPGALGRLAVFPLRQTLLGRTSLGRTSLGTTAKKIIEKIILERVELVTEGPFTRCRLVLCDDLFGVYTNYRR